MIPYIILVVIPFVFGLCELICQKYQAIGSNVSIVRYGFQSNIEKVASWICLFIFIFIVGGTDGNGLDWWTTTGGYAKVNYNSISLLDWSQFEGGFVLANQLAGNFHVFIFLMALVCFFIVLRIVKYESPFPIISLFIFIVSSTLYSFMGVYRHAIAQTIVMLVWLYRDNWKKQILIVLIAMCFHVAAIVGIIYIFIPKSKVLPKKIIIGGLLCCFLVRIAVMYALPLMLSFLWGPIGEKLEYYALTEGFEGSFGLNYFIFRCLIVWIAYLVIDRNDKRQVFYFNAYLLSVAVYIALTISDTFFRLAMFFSVSEIVLIPIILRQIKRKSMQSLYHALSYILFAAMYSYSYFKQLIESKSFYLPYKSIFFV